MARKKVCLNDSEAAIIRKLARRSKMDCWLYVDEYNRCRNLENRGRVMSTRNAVKAMVEGLVEYDVQYLTPTEILIMLDLCYK